MPDWQSWENNMWEYRTFFVTGTIEDLRLQLADAGAEGWELVTVVQDDLRMWVFMKRPLKRR